MKISVVAHPNSKRPRVEKDLLENYHVYVSAPPLEGRANEEIVEALSKHFRVKRSEVFIISGHKSKNKVFEIITPS